MCISHLTRARPTHTSAIACSHVAAWSPLTSVQVLALTHAPLLSPRACARTHNHITRRLMQVYLRLFKLVFGSVNLFAEVNEKILQPHLSTVIHRSMEVGLIHNGSRSLLNTFACSVDRLYYTENFLMLCQRHFRLLRILLCLSSWLCRYTLSFHRHTVVLLFFFILLLYSWQRWCVNPATTFCFSAPFFDPSAGARRVSRSCTRSFCRCFLLF